MLKFGNNEVAWEDISEVSLEAVEGGQELAVTVDETILVIGVFASVAKALSYFELIEAARVALAQGGVLITVIIDDL